MDGLYDVKINDRILLRNPDDSESIDCIEGTVITILDDSVIFEPLNMPTVVRFKITYDTNTVSFLHSEDGSRYITTGEFKDFEIQNADEPSAAEEIRDNLDDFKSVELDYEDVIDDFEKCRLNAKKDVNSYDIIGGTKKCSLVNSPTLLRSPYTIAVLGSLLEV